MLYGHKAEISLTDYFLERRVIDVQSNVREGGGALREAVIGLGPREA